MRPISLRALEGLNFFAADVQAGIGPFLGVYLETHQWHPDAIGYIMTLAGIAGLIATGPAGAFIDATRRKRGLVIAGNLVISGASCLLWMSTSIASVAVSQVVTAVAGATLGPALTGITLGMVGQQGFDHQFGRNQVANHAGNVIGAALGGLLGWRYGFAAILVLSIAFGMAAALSVAVIPSKAIDHHRARGLEAEEAASPSHWREMLTCKPLLILAGALVLFHLGNAALLPFYGLAVVAAHQGDPAIFTAETVVVAQAVMVVTSLLAMRLIPVLGHWRVILLAFMALPIRGVIAALVIRGWGVWPVQALDGIGAGLLSVAVPALVTHLLRGTGHVNAGQGGVLTLQGVGAALSPALAGAIVAQTGYRPAFLVLGAISLGSLALWLLYANQFAHRPRT